MSACQRGLVSIAIILSVAVLAISLTALLHDGWIEYQVKAITDKVAAANRHYEYYSRTRGLIWICTKADAAVIKHKSSEVKFSRCFEETYSSMDNASSEMYVINLRRTQLGLKAAGIFCALLGQLIGFAGLMMWCLRPKADVNKYRHFRGHVVACWVLSALLSLAAMSVYHYVLDLEKYMSLPKLPRLYVNWAADVQKNTVIQYGFIYYMEWGSIAGLVLAAFLLRQSVSCFAEEDAAQSSAKDDRTYLYHSNPMMMQLSPDSLPPYDAYKSSSHPAQTEDGHSARSGYSSRLPRYGGDSTYDNQAKNVYRIY